MFLILNTAEFGDFPYFKLIKQERNEGLRPNWPPARGAYAPEGMLEYWNYGIMGPGKMHHWVFGKIRPERKVRQGNK